MNIHALRLIRSDTAAPPPAANVLRFTEREREFVFGVAMKYMKDEEKAADVTQDALLLAYRHRDSFRGDSRFTTWLYRIAATTALMHLRKERSTPHLQPIPQDDEDGGEEPRSQQSSPEEAWAASEAVQLASARLSEMGDKYGGIFAMRFLEGYSESEIADQLSLNVSTVKTRAYRARALLKKELTRSFADALQAEAA
jgi:RNA polymerase sigma-70 factor (ECF subfamily)